MEREAEQQRETEVGDFLRTYRLRSGLTLSEASSVLCIREAYLRAIEDGRFADLPGPTYVAGFIRAYSDYLGLDGNEVVRQLKAEPLGMDGGSELRFPSPMSEGGMPSGAVLLLGGFVALVAYGAWYMSSSRDESITELVSPLPERLVAFLRDGEGVAGTDGAVQHQIPPEDELQTRQSVARDGLPARDQAPLPVSQEQEQLTSATGNMPDVTALAEAAGTRDQGEATAMVENESGPMAVSSAERMQGDESVMGTLDPETAIRGSLKINDNLRDEEAMGSTGLPPARIGAPTQPLNQSPAELEPPSPAEPPSPLKSRIVLRAKDENWVEIREGDTDRLVVARLFKSGDTFDVPAIPGLRLLTGNAGGLEILVDGEPVPSLGTKGMVRRNIPLDAEQLRSGALARN